MRDKFGRPLFLFAATALALTPFVTGCAPLVSTKPNPVVRHYLGHEKFAQSNRLMANELGKLPEIQDGISHSEAAALERLAEVYRKDPERFDKVFEKMYKVGLPEVRKYCTPLQTLFWMAQDGNVEELDSILQTYTLSRLLTRAWYFKDRLRRKVLRLSEKDYQQIIEATKKEDRNTLRRVQPEQRNEFIVYMYKSVPEFFSREARQIIDKALVIDTRWEDFDVVTARLNSPELVDYYERARIRYHYETGMLENYGYVFRYNVGHCMMITAFTRYCLQKAGYKAVSYIVTDSEISAGGYNHRACLFEVNGRKYIMDNGRNHQLGIVRFEDYNYNGRRWSTESYLKAWKDFQ